MRVSDVGGVWGERQRLLPNPAQEWIWLFAFLVLPFASYLSLGLLGILLLAALFNRADRIVLVLWQQGFLLLTGGLILSASFALEPGNAFLQIANFVPYFLLFAVLQTWDGLTKQAVSRLDLLAKALLLTSIPISLLGLFEYAIQFPAIAPHIQHLPAFDWAFNNAFGQRAHAILSHPNILSAYLVIMLGLGLGLTLQAMSNRAISSNGWGFDGEASTVSSVETLSRNAQDTPITAPGIYLATALSVGGIFCSGSRNGLLIAVGMLVVVGLLFARRSRFLALMGLGVAITLVTGTVFLGAGGRAFNLALMTQDPRLGVWQIALSLIQHRPWLGWGLGGFSALYVPMSVPPYEHIFHAHNLWLYLASEVGLPLMVVFNIVIGRIYARGVKTAWLGNLSQSQKSVLLTYLLAFGGCLAFGLFDVTLFDARINVLSWLLLTGIALLTQNSSGVGHSFK